MEPGLPQRPDDSDPHGVPQPGPLGARETSGVQVRLGRRDGRSPREPVREPHGQGRKVLFAGLAAFAVAAVLIGAFVVPPMMDDDEVAPEPQTVGETNTAGTSSPPAGTPVDVATADGSKYRIAAVTAGLDKRANRSQSTRPPAGTSFAYIDYVLTNPSGERSLLDFPGDLFVRRDLVAQLARGRCVWQPGVPEAMCTPPVKSVVVRRLAGRDLEPGDGGDQYLPPGSSFLVRATAEVPVSNKAKRTDLRLYIWKQLYMADQLAKEVPFPG